MSLDYRVTPLDYDLTVAGSQTIDVFGDRIQVVSTSDINAEVTISVIDQNLRQSEGFPLTTNGYIQFPEKFTRLKVEWTAQSGITIRLAVIGLDKQAEFKYVFGGGDVVEGISTPIMTTGGKKNTHAKVTVATTPTLVIPATDDITAWTIKNMHTLPIYIGDATVDTATGYPIEAGAEFTGQGRAGVYSVVGSATAEVRRFVEEAN